LSSAYFFYIECPSTLHPPDFFPSPLSHQKNLATKFSLWS
jgi:hypothetical protein